MNRKHLNPALAAALIVGLACPPASAAPPPWQTKAGPATAHETKAFKIDFKEIGEDGTFEGYANTFNFVDHHKDNTQPGAFKRTIDHWRGSKKQLPILYQHNPGIVIGYIDPGSMEEDGKGLKIKGNLILDLSPGGNYVVPEAAKVHALMKARVLDSMSIGYDTIKDKWEKGVRNLLELKLYEVSIVLWPANEESTVTSVKARMKAADFATTLQQAVTRDAMFQARWKIEDALWESNHATLQDEDMDDASKLAQITANLAGFADAMAAWFAQAMALGLFTKKAGEGPASVKDFAGHPSDETKAGKPISAANAAKITAAFEALGGLMGIINPPDPADDGDSGKQAPGKARNPIDPNSVHSIVASAQAIGLDAMLKGLTRDFANR